MYGRRAARQTLLRSSINGPYTFVSAPLSDLVNSALLTAYLAKKNDLRRFFIARTGSVDQADDLVQELYVKVAAIGNETLIENAPAYLYRLAANLMLDRMRQQRRSSLRDGEWLSQNRLGLGDDVDDQPDPVSGLAARQSLAQIVAALGELTPQTRRVFQMHKFEGLSHAQVAARLGISRSAVEKHVSTALKHLLRLRP